MLRTLFLGELENAVETSLRFSVWGDLD